MKNKSPITKYYFYIRYLAVFTALCCFAINFWILPAEAKNHVRSIRVLAIGNSHSYCGTEYLYDVLEQCGYEDILVASCHKNMCDLQFNFDSLVNDTPSHTFRYTTDGTWTMVSNYSVKDALVYAPWDYVIFQHKLVAQAIPDAYVTEDGENYASLIADYARTLVPNPKVQIGWNMLWAFHNYYTPEFDRYFDCDSETLYADTTHTVKEYIYDTGAYDFMVYTGPTVENIYYNSYLKNTLLLGYYAETGTYNSSRGIHLGGTIGAYTEAMCFAKGIGADISRVKHFQLKTDHEEYRKLSHLHLRTIRQAINEAWADPWKEFWKNTPSEAAMKPAFAAPKKGLTYNRFMKRLNVMNGIPTAKTSHRYRKRRIPRRNSPFSVLTPIVLCRGFSRLIYTLTDSHSYSISWGTIPLTSHPERSESHSTSWIRVHRCPAFLLS